MIQEKVNQLLGIGALGVRGLQATYQSKLDATTALNKQIEDVAAEHPELTRRVTHKDDQYIGGTEVNPEVQQEARQQAGTGGSIMDLKRRLAVEKDIQAGKYLTHWHQDIGEIHMEQEGQRQVQQKQEYEQLIESFKQEPTSFGVPVGKLPPKMRDAAIAAMLKDREETNNG